MSTTQTSRAVKGSPLTATDHDNNLGGDYVLTNGGEEIDGGIYLNAGSESSLQTSSVARLDIPGHTLAPDLIYGTVEFVSDNGAGLVFDKACLHGHRREPQGYAPTPNVNYATGLVTDPINYLREGLTGTNVEVRYRTATSSYRWRHKDFNTQWASLKWWGVSDGENVYGDLCHALNTCARLGIATLRLDGDYVVNGPIEIPDGVTLASGKLTYAPGIWLEYTNNRGQGFTHNQNSAVGQGSPGIFPASGSTSVGLFNIEIDGNNAAQATEFQWLADNPNGTGGSGTYANMQTAPYHCGFWSTSHGGRDVENTVSDLSDVHIHDVGLSLLLSSGGWIRGKNIRLGDGMRSRKTYSLMGDFVNVVTYGSRGSGANWQQRAGTLQGLRVQDLTKNTMDDGTYYTSSNVGVVSYDGLDYSYPDPESNPNWRYRGVNVEGFHIDLDGDASPNIAFSGLGHGFHVAHGTVLGSKLYAGVLAGEFGPGTQQNCNLQNVFSNINIVEKGHGVALTGWGYYYGTATFEKITRHTSNTFPVQTDSAPCFSIIAGNRSDPRWLEPIKHSYRDIEMTASQWLVNLQTETTPGWTDVLFDNCTLRLTTNTIARDPTGSGLSSNLPNYDHIRLFFENCLFIIDPGLSNPGNRDLFDKVSTLRNTTHFWNGTMTFAADGFPPVWT